MGGCGAKGGVVCYSEVLKYFSPPDDDSGGKSDDKLHEYFHHN